MNSSLTWLDHIYLIKQKVCKTIGILKYVRNKLTQNVLKSIYYALVHPYYDYGNIVWATGDTVALHSLMKTQKRAIRIITSSQWNAHTRPMFIALRILQITDIHKLQVACFMFKVQQGQIPKYFCDMFSTNSEFHSYATRHANDYHIMYHRTSLLKNSIRIAGPLLWNTIDHNIRVSTNINIFKSTF